MTDWKANSRPPKLEGYTYIMLKLRFFPSLLFALVLLYAQQGGALHTLSHVFAEQTQQQNKKAPHTHDCEQCTTYAQLGSALNSVFMSFDFCSSLAHAFTQHYLVLFTQHTITAIARGPPTLQRSI